MLELFNIPFRGFGIQDFAAYMPEKWSSNLHTRARSEVRDKLNALGKHLAPVLADAQLDLAWATNDPAPNVFNGRRIDAQWLFFTRNEEQQRQLSSIIDREKSIAENIQDAAHHKRHIMLGLCVEQSGLRAMLSLHRNASVDVRNSAQKLRDPWEFKRLDLLLTELAAQSPALVFATSDGAAIPIADLRAAHVLTALEQLQRAERQWLALELRLAFDDPRVHQEALQSDLATLLTSLGPIYTLLRWARDNDFMELREQLDKKRELNKREGVTLEPGAAVHITGGLFAGKDGVVQEIDKKGMARVAIGKLVVQVKGTALQRIV